MAMPPRSNIVITRNLRIGDLEAETDTELLQDCFVDNGTLETLMNVSTPESIVVGRTGSGKSALLIEIERRGYRSRLLDPHDISMRFLESSDIIQFFEALGINLDLFYRLLWRHLIVVELLKLRYDLRDEADGKGLISRLLRIVERDPVKKEALSYFRGWGDRFWLETDEHLKEVTKKLSNDLRAGIGGELGNVDISLKGARSLTSEEKSEVVNRATRVVSQIQIKKLGYILELLQESIFDDPQKRYYILIDKLDEEWASTETRYKFIRALIEEIKTFRRVKSVKIIVAMRRDLIDIVFDKTRGSGFQQEKYESYIMPVLWNRDDLEKLVKVRINEVFKRQYTKDDVTFQDVFPLHKKGGAQSAMDYIIGRTLLRPRDVMQFINECFTAAYEKRRVTWRVLTSAESIYSERRLKSLFEEWADIYPSLEKSVELLRDLPQVFTRSTISGNPLAQITSDLLDESNSDPCVQAVKLYCEPGASGTTEADVVTEFLACFYKIGAIGVKISKTESYMWSDYDHATLSKSEAKRVNQIKVHRMLHRALGIRLS